MMQQRWFQKREEEELQLQIKEKEIILRCKKEDLERIRFRGNRLENRMKREVWQEFIMRRRKYL